MVRNSKILQENAGRRNDRRPGKKDAAGGPLTGPPAADRAT
jgi:hypothetical protein